MPTRGGRRGAFDIGAEKEAAARNPSCCFDMLEVEHSGHGRYVAYTPHKGFASGGTHVTSNMLARMADGGFQPACFEVRVEDDTASVLPDMH